MTLVPASSVRGGFPLGLAGATAATRYVGATASGAPASGTFAVGDFVIDQSGSIYICTVAGTPGTWVQVGATAGGMVELGDVTRGSTGAITFSAIPATSAHLLIVASLRGVGGVVQETLRIRFNADAGANYDSMTDQVTNVTVTNNAPLAANAACEIGQLPGGNASADKFGTARIYIPNYAAAVHKSCHCDAVSFTGTTAATFTNSHGGGLWRSTAAITEILLWTATGAGEFAALSRATLYGLS